jgi:hypothetical protein
LADRDMTGGRGYKRGLQSGFGDRNLPNAGASDMGSVRCEMRLDKHRSHLVACRRRTESRPRGTDSDLLSVNNSAPVYCGL